MFVISFTPCLLLIILQTCSRIRFGVYGELTVFPVDTAVEVGSDVRLNCTTISSKPVNWQHGKDLETMADVYIGGEGLVRPYSKTSRHSMDEYPNTGRYDLIIKSVAREDEGIYVCSETSSRDNPPQARLTVTGTDAEQQSCLNYEICKAGEKAKLEFSTCVNKPFYMDHVPVGKSHADDVNNNGRLLNDYAKSGRFLIDDSGDFCVLNIAPVKTSDAGTYTCRENSGLGQRHDKDLVVREETCDSTDAVTSRPGANEELEGNCTVSFVGHQAPLIIWKELNCNGSICYVRNVTSGNSHFCKLIDPTSESILVLSCEFSCKSDTIATYASAESNKWIVPVVVVIFLVVLIAILTIIYLKKRPCCRSQDGSPGNLQMTTLSETMIKQKRKSRDEE